MILDVCQKINALYVKLFKMLVMSLKAQKYYDGGHI